MNNHAAALGKLGGQKKSSKKAASSRKNGRLGGRPAHGGIRDWVKFMDAIDSCRRERSVDPLHRLFVRSRSIRERSLINASSRYLCSELHLSLLPEWSKLSLWLKSPWFVSGMENLKATALLESPAEFRANNIFVLGNFLSRV